MTCSFDGIQNGTLRDYFLQIDDPILKIFLPKNHVVLCLDVYSDLTVIMLLEDLLT